MRAWLLALVVAIAGSGAPVLAQDVSRDGREQITVEIPEPGETQELTLRDGSRLFGRVVSVEADVIVFRTTAGADLTVDLAGVAALRVVRGRVVNHEFVPADPNATRLLFGPTARSLEAGQGYLAVYEILMPFVQVGLTDRISFGAGTPLVFGGDTSHPFWISPKAQVFDGTRAQVAVGLLHIFAGGDDQVGIAYGVTTIGHEDDAVTIGAGYGYETSGGGGSVVVMVGGEHRVSRRLKLVTENYVWEGASGILSGGVRFIGDRLSADLGLVMPVGDDGFFAFPVVSFAWSF